MHYFQVEQQLRAAIMVSSPLKKTQTPKARLMFLYDTGKREIICMFRYG
jgi:hypothetical protein